MANPRWQKFGDLVSKQRRYEGLTQQECADIAGVSTKQWSRIETGESGTKYETIEAIAKAIRLDNSSPLYALLYNLAGFSAPHPALEQGGEVNFAPNTDAEFKFLCEKWRALPPITHTKTNHLALKKEGRE